MSFLNENDYDAEDAGFPYKVMNEIYDDEQDYAFTPLSGRSFSENQQRRLGRRRDSRRIRPSAHAIRVDRRRAFAQRQSPGVQSAVHETELGAIINSGEKLNAMVGELRDICFHELAQNRLLASIDIPTRRFAREQLAAQIVAQVIAIEQARAADRDREFARVRHMDLQKLFKDNTHVSPETRTWVEEVEQVMNLLADQSESLPVLRSRAIVLSLVLLAYEEEVSTPAEAEQLALFAAQFVGHLRRQVSELASGRGVDESYRYLLEFQKHLTQASVEKPAVKARAECLETALATGTRWMATFPATASTAKAILERNPRPSDGELRTPCRPTAVCGLDKRRPHAPPWPNCIYHVPGGAPYAKTRIDTAKGERWFCTEAKARAAGWRRAKR